jgi:hypothetical protein
MLPSPGKSFLEDLIPAACGGETFPEDPYFFLASENTAKNRMSKDLRKNPKISPFALTRLPRKTRYLLDSKARSFYAGAQYAGSEMFDLNEDRNKRTIPIKRSPQGKILLNTKAPAQPDESELSGRNKPKKLYFSRRRLIFARRSAES